MPIIRRKLALCITTACATIMATPVVTHAQDASTQLGEVVVTARKRTESLLDVPVIASAIPQQRLERLQITQISDLPKLVPGLNFGHGLLSTGTQVSIRGVGTISLDPGVDQSVALIIDGASFASGLAYGSAMFDPGGVEVYKGPQSLFHGKSATAGVISIRTADPTDQFEAIGRASYEAEAVTKRIEGIVSGPVTDTLGLRLAGVYSDTHGYFRNKATAQPGTGGIDPAHDRAPYGQNYTIRATVLWKPTDKFSARLKVTKVRDEADLAEVFQIKSCREGPINPVGLQYLGPQEDCKFNRNLRVVALDPAAFPFALHGGQPYLNTSQEYGTLELNYEVIPELTLTSTTGLYQLRSRSLTNASESGFAGTPLAVDNHFKRHLGTQELRLGSDFKGPVNFSAGVYYENGGMDQHIGQFGNTLQKLPAKLADGFSQVDFRTYSAFGELRWNITPQLELAGGARYSDEKRSETAFNFLTNAPIVIVTPQIRTKNLAPEVTLTYRVTPDTTVFGAWKKGYKSGGYGMATIPLTGVDNSFRDEQVQGGEFGVKSRLMDRQLWVSLAAYSYKFQDLQVGARTPPINGVSRTVTINAAGARTRGIDFESNYRPSSVPGLQINAALQYNIAKYKNFTNAPCFGGQLVSEGCNQLLNTVTGLYTAQDLSGTPLIRAPKWSATFGLDYEKPLGNGYTLTISQSNQYSSSYPGALAKRPDNDNYQGKFLKADLGLTLSSPGNHWELALIGKNITDKVTFGTCSISNYVGGVTNNNPSGGTTRGPYGYDEVGCFGEPGREVWLRLTLRN